MTKKELMQLRQQVKYLNEEIDIIKQQISDLERKRGTTSDVVKGSNSSFPYQMRTFKVDGIDEDWYKRRVKRLKQKLQRRIDELIEKREKLEDFIATVEDGLMRQILALRYINGLSWRQVAKHIGGGNTADSVRKYHDRYLQGE